MAIFRFLSITIISFLLLSPLVKRTVETVEKPVIVIAQDNSSSVISGKDSVYMRTDYPAQISSLEKELRKKFEVASYSFGEKLTTSIKTDFRERETDISELIDEINSRFSNRNIGAVIIASDGIYNKGANPFYAANVLKCPVYTIPLGDTITNRDISIQKVNYNRTVYVGDKFPVEINVRADKCEGSSSDLTVRKGDQVLFTKKLFFPSEMSLQKVNLFLDAKEKGIHRYTISVSPVSGEVSKVNNIQDIFIEVSETRQKIVILYQAPHPDVAALRSALESSLKFDVEQMKVDEFNQPPEKYDLVILYQLPSVAGFPNLGKLLASNTSLLFCLGSQTDINGFNNLKTGLEITAAKQTCIESVPQWNDAFALFTMDRNLLDVISEFPPLLTPYGNYQFSPASDVLLYQKIGNVQSRLPLILFLQTTGKKTGIIAGENLWKWRLSDYLQKGNHDVFNELLNKIAQFLSVKADKSFFRVKCNNKFLENEPVEIEAELYNESYELINDPDVNLTITDDQGKKYPYTFGKSDKAYFLNAGTFPPGAYGYTASAKVGNNFYQKKGEFIVTQLNVELLNTTADHNLLYRIAKAHEGEMVYPKDMQHLAELISKREDIKPIAYTQKRFADLAGNFWVFLLILAFISAEWFIRKRSGIY